MAIFKCKMCGADLDVVEKQTTCKCTFCGSSQTISFADTGKKVNLFNRANSLRMKKEFDKASAIYNSILVDYPEDAEAHWGLVLCRYGVEYVTDPITEQKIPTCNRTQYKSIFEDNDYMSAVKYSDTVAMRMYEEEARKINNIQKHILEISQREEPFDIFICYKETNSTGGRTKDSVIAQDIYEKLVERGYKVFFARVTLETKIGLYEPYIFAALNSSKIMIVIGSRKEYFESVWVKNEWTRFLDLMSPSVDKYLIPCYLNMDAYDLPEEMMDFQAQDLNKLGYLQDLVRGIDKLIGTKKVKDIVVENKQTIVHSNVNIEGLLTRIELTLEDEDYDKCAELIEKVLDNDPKNAKVYLYKLMTELEVPNVDALIEREESLIDYNDYQKALKFADKNFKDYLNGIEEKIISNIEYNKIDQAYKEACNMMRIEHYDDAISAFSMLGNHRESAQYLIDCKRLKEEKELNRLNGIYDEAIRCKNLRYYSNAIAKFSAIIDFKDSRSQIEECKNLISISQKEEKYLRASKIVNDYKQLNVNHKDNLIFAKSLLLQIKDYKDSLELISKIEKYLIGIENELIRIKEKNKKILKISAIVLTICFSIYLIVSLLIVPAYEYNKAIDYINKGDYDKAKTLLKDNSKFGDAKDKLAYIEAAEYLDEGLYETAIDMIRHAGGTVKITYHGNGGTASKEQEVIKPLSVVDETATKVGYSFLRWRVSEYSMNAKKDKVYLTLKAVYKANDYFISYQLNDATPDYILPSTFNYEKGVAIPNVSKQNYQFKGWLINDSNEPVLNLYIYPKTYAEDLTLSACFEGLPYTISLDANGGSVSNRTVGVKYKEVIKGLPTPQRVGYQFDGWYYGQKKVTNGQVYSYATNINLVAKWSIKKYSIVYSGNLTHNISGYNLKFEYKIGDTITLPNLSEEGYTFVGWKIPSMGVNVPTKDLTIPSISLTTPDLIIISYVFSPNTYSISYDTAGGIENYGTIEYTFNESLDLPTPTKVGYEFGGWYKNGALYDSNVVNIADNFTLVAHWNIKNYLMLYRGDVNYYMSGTSASYTIESNKIIYDPSADGYTFVGWTVEELGIDIPKKNLTLPEVSLSTPKIITLYANFIPNKYKITFNVNGGKENYGTIEYTYGERLLLPVPTKDGYAFSGWYKNGVLYNSEILDVPNDFVLIAHWSTGISGYTVQHYLETLTSGEYNLISEDCLTAATDLYITAETNEYEGFTSPDTISIRVTGDGNALVKYYYTRNSYTVSFESNGGTIIESIDLKYEESLPDNIVSSREGYTFGGWYEDVSLTIEFTKQGSNNITVYAYWLEETTTSSFSFNINENSSTITGFIGEETNVVIPQYIGGKKVLTIGQKAFEKSEIYTIVLPRYLEGIMDDAFSSSNVSDVEFNDSIKYIGSNAFNKSNLRGTISLENLTGLSIIQNGTFAFTSINRIILPESVNVIGSYAFQNIYYLYTVQMPGVKSIMNYAFMNCSSLSYVDFSNNNVSIGDSAFLNTAITSMVINASLNLSSGSLAGMNKLNYLELDKLTVELGYLFKSSVPESLRSIKINGGELPQYAFRNCSSVTSLDLNVTSIGINAFVGMSSLTLLKLNSLNSSVLSLFGTDSYEGSYEVSLVSNTSLKYYVPLSLHNVIINTGIIPNEAFVNCSSITNLTLGSNVTKIGLHAFMGTSISEFISPESLTTIEGYAFSNCKNLVNLSISDSVTTIGSYAFFGCESVEVLDLAQALEIGDYAFGLMRSLVEVYINENISTGGLKFESSGCEEGFVLYIGDKVSNIKESTFSSSRIQSIEFGESPKLENIGPYAFSNIKTLKTVTIPSSVTTIDDSAFYGSNCDLMNYEVTNLNGRFEGLTLNTLNVKNGVEVIPDNFMTESTVKYIEIETDAALTTIGAQAFDGSGLQNIIIPENVINIGYSAFANNLSVSTIIFAPKRIEQLGANIFSGAGTGLTKGVMVEVINCVPNYLFYTVNAVNPRITELTIGESVNHLGLYAFYGAVDHLETINYNARNSTIDSSSNVFNLSSHEIEKKPVTVNIGVNVLRFPAHFTSNSAINLNIKTVNIQKNSSINYIGENYFDNVDFYVQDIKDYIKITWSTTYIRNHFSEGGNLYLNGELVQDVILDDSITEIGTLAFYKSNIRSVTISDGESIININNYAFAECYELKEFNVHSRVKKLGDYAFYNSGIESLEFASEGEDLSIGTCAFADVDLTQTSLTIPGRVKFLGSSSFSTQNDSSLTSIILNEGIQKISSSAFLGNFPLVRGIYVPNSVEFIGDNAFSGLNSLMSISIPFLGNSRTGGSTRFEQIYGTIPQSLQSITIREGQIVPDYAFYNLSKITSVYYLNQIIHIGNHAFDGCYSLRSLNLSSDIIYFGEYGLSGVNINVSIPISMTQITNFAFANFKGEIEWNTGITSIGSGAFYNTNCFETLDLTNVHTIGYSAFINHYSLETVILPNQLATIGSNVFDGCSNLKQIIFSDNFDLNSRVLLGWIYVENFDVYYNTKNMTANYGALFYSNTSIKNLFIGSGVEYIPEGMFNDISIESVHYLSQEMKDTQLSSMIGTRIDNLYILGSTNSTLLFKGSIIKNVYYSSNVAYSLMASSVEHVIMSISVKEIISVESNEIYYNGTVEDFEKVIHNGVIDDKVIYYYSTTLSSTDTIKYWHYENGNIVINE